MKILRQTQLRAKLVFHRFIFKKVCNSSAIDIARGEKVLDAALKYGWETSESFSKAFSRFHGTPPDSVKGDTSRIKVFMPLKIQVKVVGPISQFHLKRKMTYYTLIFRGVLCIIF